MRRRNARAGPEGIRKRDNYSDSAKGRVAQGLGLSVSLWPIGANDPKRTFNIAVEHRPCRSAAEEWTSA